MCFSKRLFTATALIGLFAFACSPAPTDLCAKKSCEAGFTCNPVDGSCVADGSGGGLGGSGGGNGVGGGVSSGGGTGTGGQAAGGGTAMGGGLGGGTNTGGGQSTGGGVGGGSALAGDTCASAINISNAFAANADGGLTATLQVDLSTAASDYYGSCEPLVDQGGELVFAFPTSQPQDIWVTATPADGGGDAFVYLKQSVCESFDDLACADDQGPGQAETIAAFGQPAGTYYLVVDSHSAASAGAQTVTVTLSTPLPKASNDTCASPIDITPANNGTSARVTNTLTGAGDHSEGSCGGLGADLVYKLTLTTARDVELTATGLLGILPALYVRRTCTDASSEVLSGCALGGPGPATLKLLNLQPGTYFIIADSYGGSPQGPVTLELNLSAPTLPPANDTCVSPIALLNGVTQQTVTGTTQGAVGDYASSLCGGEKGLDVVYAFTTTGTHQLTASLQLADAGPALPVLHLVPSSSCLPDGGTTQADLVGCVQGLASSATGTLSVSRLPAGDYLLVVDANAKAQTAFTLSARLDPPASATATSCISPALLTFDSQHRAVATGNTSDAGVNLAEASCAFADLSATGSAVYTFVTPSTGEPDGGFTVRVSASTTNAAELHPLVALSTTCPRTMASELACGSGDSSPAFFATTVVDRLTAGTAYYVWVAGTDADAPSGPYALSVALGVNKNNETCATAATLPLNTTVASDTLVASDDAHTAGSSYLGCATPYTFDAGDLVYAFTATTAGEYVVRLFPEPGFDATLSVLSSCAASACVGLADDFLSGEEETVVVNAAAGLTYYVVVDGWRPDARGGFMVSVSH